MLFTIITFILVHLSHPAFGRDSYAYDIVLGNRWGVTMAVLIAFIVSGFINIKLIIRWKFPTQEKYFW
ncbi:MAG: hypothetical protein K0S27_1697 [Gammaproteobacteria bacterium]|nr:hypothetical protein [Gammaproteobacteria bacterium]